MSIYRRVLLRTISITTNRPFVIASDAGKSQVDRLNDESAIKDIKYFILLIIYVLNVSSYGL